MSPTTTQPDPQIVGLVAAQAAARSSFASQAEAITAASAGQFNGWYDSAAITAWAAELAQRVEGLQRAVAQTTDAYLSRVLTVLAGKTVRPVGRVDVTDLRNGVSHAGAYARAADVYRYQQSEFDRYTRQLAAEAVPAPFQLVDPVQAAVQRVKAVADMDVQLADRAQTSAVYAASADKGVAIGYRRVIHPERSKGGTCGLCIAASDRIYSVDTLRALHAHCECTTLPVTESHDPGLALNSDDLARLYREAGGTQAAKLKATRYRIDEHGELGPVLTKQGQPIRPEVLVRRQTGHAGRTKSEAQQVEQLRRLRDGMAPALGKARQLASDDPKKWGTYLARLEDRLKGLDQQLAA